MSSHTITPLSFCVLPSRFDRRDLPPGFSERSDSFLSGFDDNTLFYDVFQSAEPGIVYAVGPPLRRTFRRFIKSSQLTLNGIPATMREISQSKRAALIEISADVIDPLVLGIRHPQLSVNLTISSSRVEQYRDRRALFTLSRNNDLEWIRDWAQYHIETQGVDAIVVFDNASDRYGADALLNLLAGLSGLKAYDVVPAPFQYGPSGNETRLKNARYLQFGLFEIVRLRFLQQAYGVLNMDVDEMAYAPPGANVFDAAASSDAGFLTLKGGWRYPRPGEPVCHASHLMRAPEGNEPMYPKWCLNPQGPHSDKSWRTHGLKGLADQIQDGFGFFHCRMISQSWYYDRADYTALALEPDALAEAHLGRVLKVPAS